MIELLISGLFTFVAISLWLMIENRGNPKFLLWFVPLSLGLTVSIYVSYTTLLGKPKLDFEKNIAIVLLNPDTVSSIPVVLSISEDAETRWIEVEYPAKPIGESFPYGTGTYRIAIIPFSGEKKKTYFDIDAD